MIEEIVRAVENKHCQVVRDTNKVPKLSIYMGEALWRDLKMSIRGVSSRVEVEFFEDDVIYGHPVYRVINDDTHFKVVNDGEE